MRTRPTLASRSWCSSMDTGPTIRLTRTSNSGSSTPTTRSLRRSSTRSSRGSSGLRCGGRSMTTGRSDRVSRWRLLVCIRQAGICAKPGWSPAVTGRAPHRPLHPAASGPPEWRVSVDWQAQLGFSLGVTQQLLPLGDQVRSLELVADRWFLVIPGVGLAVGMLGALIGLLAGGLWAALVNMGVLPIEVAVYRQGNTPMRRAKDPRRGRTRTRKAVGG